MMRAGAAEFLDAQSVMQGTSGTKVSLVLVSPCSTCSNQLSAPANGLPACPRQYWMQRLKDSQGTDSDVNVPATPPEYLTRKGLGSEDADADSLENPVSWETGGLRLIWVAALEENQALFKSDGSLLNPNILDEGFDTQYIQCRTLPYISGCREGDYYAGNQLVEKNFALATQVCIPQYDADDPTALVQISGFVTKVTPLQKLIITPGKKSVNQKGT